MVKSKIAPRLGTKRKFAPLEIKPVKIPLSLQTFVNPITGNIVKRATFLKATREIKRRQEAFNELEARVERMERSMNDRYVKHAGKLYKINDTTKSLTLAQKFNISQPKAKSILNARAGVSIEADNKIFKIVNTIKENDVLEIILRVTMILKISEQDNVVRYTSSIVPIKDKYKNLSQKDISNIAVGMIDDYIDQIGEEDVVLKSYNIEVSASKTATKYRFDDMKLREADTLRIFNESVVNVTPKGTANCVRSYLRSRYPKLSKKVIDKLGDDNGVSTAELKQLCESYNIPMHIFDVSHTCIERFIPNKKTKSYKALNLLINSNHIYEIKNNALVSKKPDMNRIIYAQDLNAILVNSLNSMRYPDFISIAQDTKEMNAIMIGNNTYTNNPHYSDMYDLLKSYGLQSQIRFSTTPVNVGKIIEKLYTKDSVASFWPGCAKPIGGYTYSNKDAIPENEDDIVTSDKCKCYSYILKYLSYLIKVDYRVCKRVPVDEPIREHYLYSVKPYESTILMPTASVYTGRLLMECDKEGVKYDIIDAIETTTVENIYGEMIEDLYNKSPKHAKDIMNTLIGQFDRTPSVRSMLKFNKICNADELQRSDNVFSQKIEGTDYYMVFKYDAQKSLPDIMTKKPINIQIKDGSRILMYRKIKELKLRRDEIIQVKTDSITFNNERLKHKLESSYEFDDWKLETYCPINAAPPKMKNLYKFEHPIFRPGQHTELITGDAGNGKTYHIINKLIPTLRNYIVLTPTHAALKEYRNNNLSCDVIQKYSNKYATEIPEARQIIIDEIGLVTNDDWGLIIKLIADGRDVYAFGDFTQLLPFNSEQQINENELFINSIFNKFSILDQNYRNNFSKEYYRALKNNPNKTFLQDEVHKHEVPEAEAEYIITYRKTTRDQYNQKALDRLGLEADSVGARVICHSNDLREHEIYNKFQFIITKSDDEHIELDDKIKITKNQFQNNFRPAYAVNIHQLQGASIKSYYYAREDDYFIDNRSAYTIISRIKNKETKQKTKKPGSHKYTHTIKILF